MMFLLMTAGKSIGFGWGKPVMVNPLAFTRKLRMRVAHMLVAAAGPAMNLLLGTTVVIVHAMLLKYGVIDDGSEFNRFLHAAAFLNFILMFFNLIPAPPLDGGAVVEGLLPERLVPEYQKFAVYGPFVLLAVIFIPQLRWLFVTPAYALGDALYGLFGITFS